MKKYFTLLMLILVPAMMMAQKTKNRHDEAAKGDKEKFDPEVHRQKQHEFMTERAELNKEDSVKFFAIYDEMRVKERELFGDSREMRKKRPETDAECRAAMLHVDSLELATKQLQCDYHQRLLDAISPKKAALAIMAGEEFDRMAFREMMRDWKRDNDPNDAMNGKKDKRHKKGNFDGPDSNGPHPGPGFHGHPGGPGMEGGPTLEGPRPDGPDPDNAPDKDKTTK